MLFSEVKVGKKFTYKGVVYKKVPPEYKNCCTLKLNARVADTNEAAEFKNNIVVENVEDTTPTDN